MVERRAYVTIHRLAGDGRVHGLFQCAADHCKSFFPQCPRRYPRQQYDDAAADREKTALRSAGSSMSGTARPGSHTSGRRGDSLVPGAGARTAVHRDSLCRGLSIAPDHSGFIVEPYSILISARTFCGSTHG